MTDDLFPGFASHWIDGEAGRVFARSGGSGPPLVLLHGFPQTHAMLPPHRAGARRDAHGRLPGSARLRLVVGAERRRRARDLFEARHGPRRDQGHGEARSRAFRARRPRSRRPRRLPPRARPSRPRRAAGAPRHRADLRRLAAHPRRPGRRAALGLPAHGRSRSRRPRSAATRSPISTACSRNGRRPATLEALRPARARGLPAELQRTLAHPRLLRGLPRRRDRSIDARTRPTSPPAGPSPARCSSSGAILPHPRRPRRSRGAARRLAPELRAASHRHRGRSPAISSPRKRRRRRLRRCKPSSEHRSRERRRRPPGGLFGHEAGVGEPAFDTARLAAWLGRRIEGFEGPLEVSSSRAGSRTRPICSRRRARTTCCGASRRASCSPRRTRSTASSG